VWFRFLRNTCGNESAAHEQRDATHQEPLLSANDCGNADCVHPAINSGIHAYTCRADNPQLTEIVQSLSIWRELAEVCELAECL